MDTFDTITIRISMVVCRLVKYLAVGNSEAAIDTVDYLIVLLNNLKSKLVV